MLCSRFLFHSATGTNSVKVHRVLKAGGILLYVTYRQPHFVKPILNRNDDWRLNMDILGGGDSSFEYFGFALSRNKQEVPAQQQEKAKVHEEQQEHEENNAQGEEVSSV